MYLPTFEARFARGSDDIIAADLRLEHPTDQAAEFAIPILRFIRTGDEAALPSIAWADPTTATYMRNMHRIAGQRWADLLRAAKTQPPETRGEDYDFLASDPGPTLPAAAVLNHLAMARIPATRDVAIATTMRNEGPFILEWLAYYRLMGVESFVIFSNANSDGSDDLLRELHRSGFITWVSSECAPTTSPQKKAFQCALETVPQLRQFEYVFFVDVDEYIVLAPQYVGNLKNLIAYARAKFGEEMPVSISFNWRMFRGGAYEWSEAPMIQRFQYWKPSPHAKSLFRIHDVVSARTIHIPVPKRWGFMANSKLEKYTPYEITRVPSTEYGGGFLNHYWGRSFQEFSSKILRGKDLAQVQDSEFKRQFDDYFQYEFSPSEERRFVPDAALVARHRAEMDFLLSISGIATAHQATISAFQRGIREQETTSALRQKYEAGLI